MMVEFFVPIRPEGKAPRWTAEEVAWLTEFYPAKGLQWCAQHLGRPAGAVRYKASELGLKATGVSEAWQRKQAEHAEKLRGRKRPEQAAVVREMQAAGKFAKTPEQLAAMGARTKARLATNGHPRGALGLKHTAEAKAVIGQKSKAHWESLSVDERDEAILRQAFGRRAAGVTPPARGSWKAGWREVGPQRCYFRSRWEANYARYLEWLRGLGQIQSWEHEAHTFWFEGIRRGCVSYLPDFKVVNPDGGVQWHEVKGWMDDRSSTTLKRMAKYHPKEVLVLIQAKQYREIVRKVSALIPGWET